MNNTEIIDNITIASDEEIRRLLETFSEDDRLYAAAQARTLTDEIFGRRIYTRGLIEFTNICRNDCLYCGIRCSNSKVERYRLSVEQIMDCCRRGYEYGFRTFVLQGGEDSHFTDELMTDIISQIRGEFPDCAITVSIGERPRESYDKFRRAGADRYLLRHETIDREHYGKLHPAKMSYDNRLRCLNDLKDLGFQTGCGIMVGSPFQTMEIIARDLIYMRKFEPQMVGIGPFIPQKDTPFGNETAGSVELTLFLLSLIRLMLPHVLLPATTALGSLEIDGRIKGIEAGANVIMPNLSPLEDRDKYLLYDNKAGVEDDAQTQLDNIKQALAKAGYELYSGRGDYMYYCQ